MLTFMVDLATTKISIPERIHEQIYWDKRNSKQRGRSTGIAALIYIQLMAFIAQILMIFVYKILCQNVSVIKEIEKDQGCMSITSFAPHCAELFWPVEKT